MQAVFLENDLLKIGILPDRGSDIFEFRYKPKEMDFLLRLRKGIQNPQKKFSQIRNTGSQFEDYYYGGWQVCLPNSAAFNYRGAELGQHGEVSLIPWSFDVIHESPDRVSAKCTVTPLRIPVLIERIFSLTKNSSALVVEETVTNTSATDLDIMWGQHIAFGLPFLKEGVIIRTNAETVATEPCIPEPQRFKRGQTYRWPNAESTDGKTVDASVISAEGQDRYSELCYLEGYGRHAFYTIRNQLRNVGFALEWDGRLFKDLWIWEERYSTMNFPWWGDCYTIALEPWTSRWTAEPQQAIDRGEWLRIGARSQIKTAIKASAFENEFKLT